MWWIILNSFIISNCLLQVNSATTCSDPNASPNECGSACQPTCAKPNPTCTLQCVFDACECNYGYILDKNNGTCILISDCPRYCNGDPNAYPTDCVSCTPACEDSEPISCVAACYLGCECIKGYTFSYKAGKCIPSTSPDCVPCPKNQRWSNCIPGECIPLTCDEIGYPVACPDYVEGGCTKSGCICKYDYVKNSKGVCVPTNKCPSCGGDKNATGGCVKSCKNNKDNYCSNYNDNVTCHQEFCDYYGCECKNGYVYNNATDLCVKPGDCSN